MPNYESFLGSCIDSNISNFARLEDTKLQFIFRKTSDKIFPLGVKATYRAFCQDSVFIILDWKFIPSAYLSYTGKNVKMQAVTARITLEPRNKITGELVGQFHLKRLPTLPIEPQGLLLGSHKSLHAVMQGVLSKFGKGSPTYLKWVSWADVDAPKSDSVIDFIRTHPPRYPNSFEFLFSLKKPTYSSLPAYIEPITSKKRKGHSVSTEKLHEIVSTPSMKTSTQPGYEHSPHATQLFSNLTTFT